MLLYKRILKRLRAQKREKILLPLCPMANCQHRCLPNDASDRKRPTFFSAAERKSVMDEGTSSVIPPSTTSFNFGAAQALDTGCKNTLVIRERHWCFRGRSTHLKTALISFLVMMSDMRGFAHQEH